MRQYPEDQLVAEAREAVEGGWSDPLGRRLVLNLIIFARSLDHLRSPLDLAMGYRRGLVRCKLKMELFLCAVAGREWLGTPRYRISAQQVPKVYRPGASTWDSKLDRVETPLGFDIDCALHDLHCVCGQQVKRTLTSSATHACLTMSTPAIDRTLLDSIAILEAENASLRQALQNGEGAERPYERLLKKYDDLSKSYRTLQERQDKYQSYVARATEKYRAAKESAKQWQQFYDHQRRKADRLRDSSGHINKASSPVLDVLDTDVTPRPVHFHATLGATEAPSENQPRVEQADENGRNHVDEEGAWLDRPDHQANEDRSRPRDQVPDTKSQQITSSQTTQDGSDPPGPCENDANSEDEPQFVSARPVKRKRGNSPRTVKASTQIKQEANSPSQPQEINSEDYSSPALKRHRPLRRETSNLDAIVGGVDSPRKRRERRAVSAELVRPPTMPTMMSSLSECGPSEASSRVLKEESGSSTEAADVRAGGFAEGGSESGRALQPLSANIARPTRGPETSVVKRKRRIEDPRAKAAMAAIVAEDGDMDSSQVRQLQKDTPDAAISRRLGSLLDEPTPVRQQIARRTAPETKRSHRPKQLATPHTRSPKAPAFSSARTRTSSPKAVFRMPNVPAQKDPVASKSATKGNRGGRSPPPPDPEDEPLRARPVIRLSIDDFKVNPKYKGTDFAFADTLRGRDQRRCMPGCTKPECCGDAFRKAVEMGFRGRKTDHEVLEAYLGPAYESHMASRTRTEREDVLNKAHAYAIANEHGKHRQAFKRRTTPPGFWRVDMASTQEEEEDRIKANEMVRQEVYDRWREAMLPSGRWKFRDE